MIALRTAVVGALLLTALIGIVVPVAAQVPVDPLQSAGSRAGEYEFDVGIMLIPYGRNVSVVGQDGRLQTEALLEYVAGAHGSVRYSFTDVVSVSLAGQAHGLARREGPGGGRAGGWELVRHEQRWSLGVKWRISPTSIVDPAIGLTIDPRELSKVAVSADVSMMLDPVVFSGGLSLQAAEVPGTSSGRVSGWLSMAFVANDQVTASFSVSHWFPLAFESVPQTSVVFGVHYALDNDLVRTVNFDTVVTTRGADVRIGFGVTLFGSFHRR